MKKIYGSGLFVKNDINGNPCHIGDIVKLTRPKIHFHTISKQLKLRAENFDMYEVNLPEKEFIGILILRKSDGVVLKTKSNNPNFYQYIKPKFSDSATFPWKWELLEYSGFESECKQSLNQVKAIK